MDKRKIKIIVAIILCIPCLFFFYKGVTNFVTYRKLYSNYEELKSNLNSPIKDSSLAVKEGKDVCNVFKSLDAVVEFSMVSELDKTSLDVVKTISIDDIPSVDNIVEVTIKSSNVLDTLKSLSSSMIVCNYINVDGDYLTVRVYVGGDN